MARHRELQSKDLCQSCTRTAKSGNRREQVPLKSALWQPHDSHDISMPPCQQCINRWTCVACNRWTE
jgi:hypothetical protein